MPPSLTDYRLFWREFRQSFHTTGAVLPSGRRLGQALASQLGSGPGQHRILEVGPGTGAVTQEVIARMGPDDHLDLVELNGAFVAALRRRFEVDPAWKHVAPRVRLMQVPVEQLPKQKVYDRIISGLPLNNFGCSEVREIFEQFHFLATDGCLLSFFEYVGIRKAKALVSSTGERQRLFGIDCILQREFESWEVERQFVLANIPPAWVHHLCLPGALPQAVTQANLQPVTC